MHHSTVPAREAKPVILGTAGHIDHGKTALVKALTGIDADRLEEEKRRGITIDIGFANLELADPQGRPLRLGFIDVPGHERFVRNMLAGIGGIDLVLFVVAADEGIKPQTREHFEICRLLSVSSGITVLTKSDLLGPDSLEVVRLELQDFLRGSFLDASRAPVVAVSAKTGAGIEELKREIARVASEIPARDADAQFRLPIDRVFTMKGFGTVVTGTLIAGSLAKEAEVEIFPQRVRARVRGIQVHGNAAERAVAGERTAVNLAGPNVSTQELARGMTLAGPSLFEATRKLDVTLSLLSAAKPLRSRARVHLHIYTGETIAEITLVGQKEIKPGESAYAQLKLSDPVLALPGDRFILRQFSPVVTIGGGVVLDASPAKQKVAGLQNFLAILANGMPEQMLLARIERAGIRGLNHDQVIAQTGWTTSKANTVIDLLLRSRAMVRAGYLLISSTAFEALKEQLLNTLQSFHGEKPLAAGMSQQELRGRLRISDTCLHSLIEDTERNNKVQVSGELVKLAGHRVVMKDDEAGSKAMIEQAFAAAGLKVPALKEVLASVKLDKSRAHTIVTLLLREKVLVKLGDDLVFHREALRALREAIQKQKSVSAKIDVGKFKEMTGVSRKYAIPLLEYLDRERVTRRAGDERIIL